MEYKNGQIISGSILPCFEKRQEKTRGPVNSYEQLQAYRVFRDQGALSKACREPVEKTQRGARNTLQAPQGEVRSTYSRPSNPRKGQPALP